MEDSKKRDRANDPAQWLRRLTRMYAKGSAQRREAAPMMALDVRCQAVEMLGYTPRQAQFLVQCVL